MNLYAFLTVYSASLISLVSSSSSSSTENLEHSRVNIARKAHESIIKNGKRKKVSPDGTDKGQIVNPRGRTSYKRPVVKTTTTKSPLQILEDTKEEERIRNPKGIKSPIQKAIENIEKQMKKLQGRCQTNAQCNKNNNNNNHNKCCMLEAGPHGYCMKFPGHYQRCSPECPCSPGFQCKVSLEINDRGQVTSSKQCLKGDEPESPDIKKMREAGRAKSSKGGFIKHEVNKDASLKVVRLPGSRRWKFR